MKKILQIIQTLLFPIPKNVSNYTKTMINSVIQQQITLPVSTGFTNNYKSSSYERDIDLSERQWIDCAVTSIQTEVMVLTSERERNGAEQKIYYIAEAIMRYLQSGYPGVLNLFDFVPLLKTAC